MILKQIVLTGLTIAVFSSNSAAFTPKIEQLENESHAIEKRIQSGGGNYCRYSLNLSRVDSNQQSLDPNAKLIVVHGHGPGRAYSSKIACPDIKSSNKNDWFQLIAKQKQLYFEIEAFLRANPVSNADIDRKIRILHVNIGRRMTCDFVRLIHDSSLENMEIARNALAKAELLTPTISKAFSLEQARFFLFSKIYSETVHPGPCSPPQCLPNVVGESVDTSLSSSKQICNLSNQSQPLDQATDIADIKTGNKAMGRKIKIPDNIWQAMQGKSWHAHLKCPARKKLRLLEIPYIGFDGKHHKGRMIVARDVADPILKVFSRLYKQKFKIERMELIHKFNGQDKTAMNYNNTSAFNCRVVKRGRSLSEHAYGRAIDINPIQNPYVRKGKVIPSAGHAYKKPSRRKWRTKKSKTPGLIYTGGPVVREFAKIGWKWGGRWRTGKHYQHFSKSGR